ncbi:MAG: formimidoylglutamate deiminase [Acidimicrobiales bacterium]|nr:formimidoylglutamate deiminase [Acidimicrobiales bacterium]
MTTPKGSDPFLEKGVRPLFWCEHAIVDGRVQSGVAIGVENGRFSSVTANSDPGEATQLMGLSVPGFANAHSHAFHRALRSRTQADRGTFWTWRELIYTVAERLDPDNYHRLARAVFAEMATTGMSVVGEFHYVHHQPDGTPYDNANVMGEALLSAAAEAGIRITLLDTLYLHGGLDDGGYQPASGAQIRYRDSSADVWADRVNELQAQSGQQVGAAIHSVRAVDPDAIRVAAEWAADANAPLHAHVSEQVAENEQCALHHGCTPTALLADAGALGPSFTAVHATHLTEHDIELLGSTHSSVCMCPTTERDLGDGIGPTTELVAANVELSLGSDSHAVVDHLIEARAVELDERLRSRQRGLHAAPELLAMATRVGHHRLGWADAGEITIGNRADLTTISLDSVRTAGATPNLAMETAVFAATASDITSVVVDGERIVADGRHVRIDVADELRRSIEAVLS